MEDRNDISNIHSNIIVDVMQAGTWQWNLLTGETVYNNRWAEIIGYTVEELMPTTYATWLSLAHPEDMTRSEIQIAQVLKGEMEHYSLEVRMKHKLGHWVWVLDSGKVVQRDETGKPILMVGTHIDITERKKEQVRSQENELFLSQIFNHTKDIIYRLATNGNFTYLSQAWTEQLGHSVEETIGKSFRPFVHPEDLPRLNSFFDIVNSTNDHQSISGYRLRHKDGSYHYYETSANAIHEDGKVVGYAGIARDITKLYQANEEIMAQKDELERFFTVSLDLLAIADATGYFYRLNKAWEKTLGFSIDYIKSKPMVDFIHPEDAQLAKETIQRIIAEGGNLNHFINRYRCFDGSYRYLEWRAQAHGTLLYGSARDITESMAMQDDLFKEKEYLRTTLLSVGDGVIATDATGKITVINRVAQTLTGFNNVEAIEQDLDAIFKVIERKNRRKIHNLALQVIQKAEPIMLKDVVLISRTGIEVPIEDSASPIIGKDGTVQGVVIVFRDVTDAQERQRKIEYLSYHDQLTDCYNRHYYEKVIKEINRSQNYPLAIISVDLNNLKLINDTFGHEIGDQTIRKAAEIIRQNLPTQEYFFRMGGDEFLIFLPRTTNDMSLAIREKIKATIKEQGEQARYVSLAYGYHVLEEPMKQIQSAIKIADQFMYQNKIKNRL